ncbi:hypothetical protein BJV77DRAFT_970294 [Russula vinacea]|nr:hypothetical protein BJV77DRAFT_970294 [Russula vinacea]
MLAHHAFRTPDLLIGSRRTLRVPTNRIHLFSDHAAKPSQNIHLVSPNVLKRDWSVRREERTRDTSHSTRQLASLKTSMFTDDAITLPSPGSPNYIPNKLRTFQSSIIRRDASAVLRHWRSLEKDNLLHLLGPSDLETCSQLVIDLCPTEHGSTWDGPSRAAAEELSLGLANRLSTSALRACFDALIFVNDSEGVLRLYNCFQSQMEHKDVFEDEDSLSSEEMEDELLTIPVIRISGSPVDKELSFFAIMAHAIQDDFSSAIQMGMKNKWNLPSHHAADAFLDSFAPSPKFRQKVLTFVRHADAARLLSRPPTFYKHLNNLVGTPATRPLQVLYATVVEGLSENYPWAAVDSGSPSDSRPVTIPESIWAAFISAFLELQRLDLAESAWDDMVRYGHKPGPGVWAVLIKGVGKLRGAGPALALWRFMKETFVSPDSSLYQAIVQVMAKARQWEDATKLFSEFRQGPSLPSDPRGELLYNTMISAHLDHSREPDAIGLLEDMLNMKSLSSMLKKMTTHGVFGDVATFSILLCALLRHKIKPNVATYTAIMTSLLQENDKKALSAALDLLGTMEESGDPTMTPNVVTYTAILSGLHGWIGRDDQLVQDCTELILRKMTTRRVKFNKVTYNVLLTTCLEISSAADTLDGDTWHIMLRGLAKRNEWVVAHEVLHDMQSSGIRMTDWLENVAEEVSRGYIISEQRLARAAR